MMITYNDLYEALRKEKYSENLQQLPSNFVKQVAEYLNDKKSIATKDADLFSDSLVKTKKQFENAISVFQQLMRIRKKKLLELCFIAAETGISKKDFENMFGFEKDLFDRIMRDIEEADGELSGLLAGAGEDAQLRMVIFHEDVDQFLGLDGTLLGPFTKGQAANIPIEIASILAKENKVELLEGGE